MKVFVTCAAAMALLFGITASPAYALPEDVTVRADGGSTSSKMPGASDNFIFFNTVDYPYNGPVVGNGTSPYVDLTNFTIAGGLQGGGPSTGNSTITTPGGDSELTGYIAASTPTFAFALEPEGITSSNYKMYNDFDVYVMYANSNGALDDSTIALSPRSTVQNGGPYGDGTETVVDVTDSGGTTTTAKFLEFNVVGLGSAFEAGENPDLVLSGTGAHGSTGVGAVSFEFVPEPSSYAMFLAGAGLLLFVARRRARA